MRDPLQADAARRWAVESDEDSSSDERPGAGWKAPLISLDAIAPATEVIVLVGAAGRSLLPRAEHAESGRVMVGGRQAASVLLLKECALVLAAQVERSVQASVASALLDALQPSQASQGGRLRVFDTYSMQLYLSGSFQNNQERPAARFLQTAELVTGESAHLRLFDVPNLQIGLSAALLAEAAYRGTPALLTLLPSLASTNAKVRPAGIYDPSPEVDDASEVALSALDQKEREAVGLEAVKGAQGKARDAWSWQQQPSAMGTAKEDMLSMYL